MATVTLATLARELDGAKRKCPEFTSRLDKAAGLLATGRVQCGETGQVWHVRSEIDANKVYLVTVQSGAWTCTCQDFERRREFCKHGLAVALLRRSEEVESERTSEPRYSLTPEGEAYLNGLADGRAARQWAPSGERRAYARGYQDGAAQREPTPAA